MAQWARGHDLLEIRNANWSQETSCLCVCNSGSNMGSIPYQIHFLP